MGKAVFIKVIVLWLLIVVSSSQTYGQSDSFENKDEVEQVSKEEEAITIGIFGTDERSTETPRSDIIMILKYMPSSHKIIAVSIPRDTMVWIPGVTSDKINHAYAYGGPNLLQNTIEYLLDTSIDYYVKLSFENFKEIIDHIGGVEVNALKDFPNNNKPIVTKGKQLLNGQQALYYVRFRQDEDGDFGRIKRQHEVLQSVTRQLIEQEPVKVVLSLLPVHKKVQTNLSSEDLMEKLSWVKDKEKITFEFYTLTTDSAIINGTWYEIVNMEELSKIKKILQ